MEKARQHSAVGNRRIIWVLPNAVRAIAVAAIGVVSCPLPGIAANPPAPAIAVPSGAEVWLQEELTDRVAGMGLVQRYRFVMPSLASLVPDEGNLNAADDLPADMLDDTSGGDAPLTPAEQAELDQALGGLVVSEVPDSDAASGGGGSRGGNDGGGMAAPPALPGDGGEIDAPLPSELAAPDAAAPGAPQPADSEAMGDLAGAAEPALPAAPDVLMQDPVHRDIVWLCEHYALPRLAAMSPRPTQVVISLASAPSPFGSFDPAVVQLFEGFSIPPHGNSCVWEPI